MAATQTTTASYALSTLANQTSVLNSTSFLTVPAAKDLVFLPFRLLSRADRALFRTFPRFLVRVTGINELSNWIVRAAFGGNGAADAGGAIMADVAAQVDQEVGGRGWSAVFAEAFQTSTFKSYWGMIHYLTSRWAFTCFIMALILNRVGVYGSSRQRIVLDWNKRLALRLIPLILFFTQIRRLLQAIRCQTSPNYSLYRHGDNNKYSLLDWSTDGGTIHNLMSTMLYWSTDEAACAAVGMSRPESTVRAPYGSFSLLWPTFLRLSLSHLVENLSCSLQRVPIMTEVGMSVFEHSLAFAEAETMLTHALGIGLFSSVKPSTTTSGTSSNSTSQATIPASGTILALTDAAAALTGPHLLDKINVPVEVLLVALLSCGNSFTSHLISVFGKQRELRLLNTGFWGICFMTAFTWGFFTTSNMVRSDGNGEGNRAVSGLLHFPTVAIVGFLPHMSIVIGIMICGFIYLVALLLTAVSLGTNPNIRQPTSLSERIVIAHNNLQAAIQIKGITIKWYEDFYTALLRLGFAALTAASEAVFLNEGRSVEMRQFTWLEEERIDEIDSSRGISKQTDDGDFQIVEEYGIPGPGHSGFARDGPWQSGYAKERKLERPKTGDVQNSDAFVYPNPRSDGVGALQRTTRFYLLFIFVRGIMFTLGGWMGFGLGAVLDWIGITARPAWLRRMTGRSLKQMVEEQAKTHTANGNKTLDFWLLTDEGKLETPKNDDLDIEPEMRKRIKFEHPEDVEEVLDEKIYDWWKVGGWFGARDESGEYYPATRSDNEDTTSVVSFSTASHTDDSGDEKSWESESEGRLTPTQSTMGLAWSFKTVGQRRSETPDMDEPLLDMATLARLLNPQDRQSREDARILSSHLATSASNGGIMTRSRYKQQAEMEKARVLLAGRLPPINFPPSSDMSNATIQSTPTRLGRDEEAEVLEQLIINRRSQRKRHQQRSNDGINNDDDQQTGPLCVVCQTSPRTIIAWPCRCLCVCEDCRVSLAMNNFGNCVTCRRNVGGFVRLWVP